MSGGGEAGRERQASAGKQPTSTLCAAMRVFAISDLHADYPANVRWQEGLSASDYRNDLLIVAGDVSDSIPRLEAALTGLVRRFSRVLYVPGNHELWVLRDSPERTSYVKLERVCAVARGCGASTSAYHSPRLSIVPLLSWYDYSFGGPDDTLREAWMDFHACVWPPGSDVSQVTSHFLRQNEPVLTTANETVITFSHFLPRLDLMPRHVPARTRMLYPVLGSSRLERQIRVLKPAIHVYGHSHVNRTVTLGGITYVNNALGYPHETHTTARRLLCIYATD